ncbi:hypothetical protein C2S52_020617 [Perilla frutescens var. hirtella]|uniref:Uncharacterized protein n=1 Tax=Perilla frutescens var. hirtella TaxID=608512 RepID=A0AAD4IVJ2_PERFH|nr:hypothetical protein C2S52_020617 [Perilla frutescens var. hirtella]KAH6805249.1 hypothetical protein C2S51_030080 [Perilla frutescens var. frutescens]KAH6822373.1 hypothetical protein C2S53_003838 [Perilla frutescens var. hirtella]
MASNGNSWGGSNAAGGAGGGPKLSKKLSAQFERTKEVTAVGVEKTKVVAAVGFEKTKVAAKKVKEGATVGVNWIKLKYNKSKLFQKK